MENAERNSIEIMAPAGSFESLAAAVQAGADSVYFGIEQLNMRSRSSYNFSGEDMEKIAGIAEENSMKTYLTLNTVIYNEELVRVREIAHLAKKAGISAVIVSDQAAISIAREEGMEVHLSTQLNISNIDTLRFYASFADVAVLARELTLDQVKEINDGIIKDDIRGPSGERIKTELFVHGALCMAISGKCYLSLHQYNHSANRGACLQACRRSYLVTEKETGRELEVDNEYIMSPKDLSTISFLDKIIEAGVSVLKIEGRARSAEYVYTVTRCYKEAVDAIFNSTYTTDEIERWNSDLAGVFNRGFWDGYYLGKELGEWSSTYGSRSTKKKIYIGKGMNYFSKIRVAEFLLETGTLNQGDEILITGPTTGIIMTTASEIRMDDRKVNQAIKGNTISIPVDQTVRRSDKLYKVVDR